MSTSAAGVRFCQNIRLISEEYGIGVEISHMKNTTYVYITIGKITDAKQNEKDETKSNNTPDKTDKKGKNSSITRTHESKGT